MYEEEYLGKSKIKGGGTKTRNIRNLKTLEPIATPNIKHPQLLAR